MNPAADPAHIAISKSKGITIDWRDGFHSEYTLEHLRDSCPCANCTGAHGTTPAPKIADNPFQLYQAKLKIDEIEPVGNYAIKIRWNDGHDAGLYTWEHLRAIGKP